MTCGKIQKESNNIQIYYRQTRLLELEIGA